MLAKSKKTKTNLSIKRKVKSQKSTGTTTTGTGTGPGTGAGITGIRLVWSTVALEGNLTLLVSFLLSVRERAYFVPVEEFWSRPSGGGDSDESRRVDIVLDSCS